MSRKQMKARAKVTSKMTKDGLVSHNSLTGVKSRNSQREQDIDLRAGAQIPAQMYSSRRQAQNQSPVNGGHSRKRRQQSASVTEANKSKSAPDIADSELEAVTLSQVGKSSEHTTVESFDIESSSDTDIHIQADMSKSNPDAERKPGKLQFASDEVAPAVSDVAEKPRSKLVKAEHRYERTAVKLEQARDDLPAKRKLRKTHVYDAQTGKASNKLQFEKEVIPQREHIKGSISVRPVKTAVNTTIATAHKKIYQVEHENVAIKASHRAEMATEVGMRSALRFHKTAPYRRVAKVEKLTAKRSVKLTYQKVLAENPKLRSSVASRMWQKRKIKKQYAKAARNTKKASLRAKKAGSLTAMMDKAVAKFARRHPAIALILLLISMLIIMMMLIFNLFSGIGSGSVTAVVSSSYLAEDTCIDDAALAYSFWETELQMQVLNIENDWPGFDEYRYDIGYISHNPLELMTYLTAVFHNFTYEGISGHLRALFDEQYSLSIVPSVEMRTRTVTTIDPGTGDVSVNIESYGWNVLTVTLTARSFTDVIWQRMDGDQFQHFNLLMQTRGNRQYINNPLAFGWLPFVSSDYGWRIHPILGTKDRHMGVDISLPIGTDIFAGHDGVVSIAYHADGYGLFVTLTGANGLVSRYAHLDSVVVNEGQTVEMGELIAKSGNSGRSTGPHLHLEVIKNGRHLNPLFFAMTGDFNLGPVYGIAGAPMSDEMFLLIWLEIQQHLGKPYVWGGSGPNVFDCSGFVSFVLNNAGISVNVGRQTATGLYNLSTRVHPSEAKPGDLIFFHSTYSTPRPVSHVGIYIGNGQMAHAGRPVNITSIETPFWQRHFFAFGRIH